jgi:hypothetical protein
MHPGTQVSQQERAQDSPGGAPSPRCPVCSGALIPLRSQYRCTRCYYSLCVGCEGADASPPVGE